MVKDAEAIAKLYGNRDTYSGVRSGYLSPDFVSESSSYRSISPDRDSVDDPDVDVESNRGHEDEDAIQMSAECQSSPVLDLAHTESKENQDTAAPSLRPASPEDASAALSDEERTSAQVSENNISTQDEVRWFPSCSFSSGE